MGVIDAVRAWCLEHSGPCWFALGVLSVLGVLAVIAGLIGEVGQAIEPGEHKE